MNIVDPISGLSLFNLVEPVAATFTSASEAYSAWATELGVSDTATLAGLVNTDDGVGEVTMNFVATKQGTSSKIMVGSEGSFGIYLNEPAGSQVSASRPITGVSGIHQNIARNYNSRNTNPALIISCKHPANDSRSENVKWQQTADSAIFYAEWRSYGAVTKQTHFAARLDSGGKLTIVAESIDITGAYLQFFLLDESATSAIAVAGEGNYSQAMDVGTIYQFETLPPKSIRGNVIGSDGQPYAAVVRAYNRVTGALAGEQMADADTGHYAIELGDGSYYLVCLDDTLEQQNALILDRVAPVE